MEEQFEAGDIVRLEKGSVFGPASEGHRAKITNINIEKYTFVVLAGPNKGGEQVYYIGCDLVPLPFKKIKK